MAKNSIKQILNHTDQIDESTLKGLYRLSNNKEVKHLFTAIIVMKHGILRDEFSYPSKEPVKNALNKEFHKGGDYFLTILVNLIKKSPELLDRLEELREKRGKNK